MASHLFDTTKDGEAKVCLAGLFWGDTPDHVRSISQSFSHVESSLWRHEYITRWTRTKIRRAHRLSSKPLAKHFSVFVDAQVVYGIGIAAPRSRN